MSQTSSDTMSEYAIETESLCLYYKRKLACLVLGLPAWLALAVLQPRAIRGEEGAPTVAAPAGA